ncbi:MAG: hypothetical protein L6Q74_13550 [Sphaerotilus natans subsp. sulfidivorans]|nr:hypothetical protein [Sphaerotilus sulfidivorans]
MRFVKQPRNWQKFRPPVNKVVLLGRQTRQDSQETILHASNLTLLPKIGANHFETSHNPFIIKLKIKSITLKNLQVIDLQGKHQIYVM